MGFSNGGRRRGEWQISHIGNIAFALLLGLLVAACAGENLETDRQLAADRVNAYLAANPGVNQQITAAMRRYELHKGMNESQVVAVWGQPRTKKKWRHGEDDQWYFECDWPNSCELGGGVRGGASEDDIYPQAFFRDGILYGWKTP